MISVKRQQQKARDWALLQGMSVKPQKQTANNTKSSHTVEQQQQKARDWVALNGITIKPSDHANNIVEHQQQKAIKDKEKENQHQWCRICWKEASYEVAALFLAFVIGFCVLFYS
jgi:hypothetical protein